jgi:hypothetical protein
MITFILSLYILIGLSFFIVLYNIHPRAWKQLIIEKPLELQQKFISQGLYLPIRLTTIILYITSFILWIFILIGVIKNAKS